MARSRRSDRLFRLLLGLFPSDFRGDFAENMHADFRDQQSEAAGKSRELRRLWLRTFIDFVARARVRLARSVAGPDGHVNWLDELRDKSQGVETAESAPVRTSFQPLRYGFC